MIFFKKIWIYIDFLIIDRIFFFISLFTFHFFPQHLHLLYKGKYIVNREQRWEATKNVEDDYIINKKPIKMFDEINILGKGHSLKEHLSKINTKIPTFHVNFYEKLPFSGNYMGINFSEDQVKKLIPLKKLFEKGLYPIIVCKMGRVPYSKSDNIFWAKKSKVYTKPRAKVDPDRLKMMNELSDFGITHCRSYTKFNFMDGAVLPTIILLGLLSNKVNVYGWDHYLEKNANSYSYYEALFKILKGIPNRGLYTRLRHFLPSALINIYYASKLLENPKYRIYSRLSSIKHHKRILEKIEKVFLRKKVI